MSEVVFRGYHGPTPYSGHRPSRGSFVPSPVALRCNPSSYLWKDMDDDMPCLKFLDAVPRCFLRFTAGTSFIAPKAGSCCNGTTHHQHRVSEGADDPELSSRDSARAAERPVGFGFARPREPRIVLGSGIRRLQVWLWDLGLVCSLPNLRTPTLSPRLCGKSTKHCCLQHFQCG